MKLNQDGVAHFAGERAVGFVVLEPMKDFGIGQVLPLMEVRLPNLVVRLVIQVL